MSRDIDDSSENVLSEWSRRAELSEGDEPAAPREEEAPAWGTATPPGRPELVEVEPARDEEDREQDAVPEEPASIAAETAPTADDPASTAVETAEPVTDQPDADEAAPMAIELSQEHAAGDLELPDGYAVLEGVADGGRRAVGVVVARFNGSVTSRLLERALEELDSAGVRRDAVTIMVVPGAFELPLAATALAKTRRFACIVALGCVIRGDTPHFEYVSSEAASGLQLAALETGVPVSFGVLTLDRVEQAEPRIEKGAEAVRSALEMADVFSQLRAAASR